MSEKRWDLLVPGRPSVDVMFSGLQQWPELGRDIDAGGLGVCAGTSFNTPAAANRLGLRVGYIAMIGNDLWSRFTREEFEAEHLPTDFLRVVDRSLPFVSVALNYDHDRGFVTYYEWDDELERELRRFALEVVSTAPARHYHDYAGEDTVELAARAHDRGMSVSVDAWGGRWMDSDTRLEELLRHADILLANETEAVAMTGATDVSGAIERLAAVCPCVVIKRDARGASAVVNGELVEAPAEPVTLVDATGAGDCFNAGFLYGWLRGLPARDSLVLGNVCGGRAVETFGGYKGCPTEEELRTIANAKGIDIPEETAPTS